MSHLKNNRYQCLHSHKIHRSLIGVTCGNISRLILLLTTILLPGDVLGQPPVGLPSSDTRFDVSIKLQCQGKPLVDVVGSLIQDSRTITEADVRTGKDASWDNVTAYIKDRPLREVLQDLAILFNYRWRQSEVSGTPGYQLDPAPKQRAFERKLWLESLDQAMLPLVNVAKYARTPSAEWEKQYMALGPTPKARREYEPEDPYLRQGNLSRLAVPFSHSQFRLFGTLSASQRRSLVEKGILFLPWNEMNSQQQALAQDCLRKPERISDGAPFTLSPEQAKQQEAQEMEWLRRFGVLFHVNQDRSTGTVGLLGIGFGGVLTRDRIAVIDASLQTSLHRFPVRGTPYPSELSEENASSPPPENANPIEGMDFPSDLRIVQKDSWKDVVHKLSASLPLPIFSDDYEAARGFSLTKSKPSTPPSDKKIPLAQGLDALCESYGYLWWFENGALFFRSRTWFIERLYEIPPPILAGLSAQIAPEGMWTTTALDMLSGLTFQQLQGLCGIGLKGSELRGSWSISSEGNDDFFVFSLLQLYATLDNKQKSAALTTAGLGIDSMTETQRHAYFFVGYARFGSRFPDNAPDLYLCVPPNKVYPSRKVTSTISWFVLPLAIKMTPKCGNFVLLPISFRKTATDADEKDEENRGARRHEFGRARGPCARCGRAARSGGFRLDSLPLRLDEGDARQALDGRSAETTPRPD